LLAGVNFHRTPDRQAFVKRGIAVNRQALLKGGAALNRKAILEGGSAETDKFVADGQSVRREPHQPGAAAGIEFCVAVCAALVPGKVHVGARV
jgi:hypothetical protein